MSTPTLMLGFLAGLLVGLLIGAFADWSTVGRVGAVPHRALLRRVPWLKSLAFALVIAGMALVLAGTAVWLNARSTPLAAFNEYVACRAKWDSLLADVYSARAGAMDQMVRAVGDPDAFAAAVATYNAVVDASPPPPDPKAVCGSPPKTDAP